MASAPDKSPDKPPDTPSDRPEGARRWRRRKHARPAEILEAAMACFAERGFAASRMEDIAARAGVTKGTVYLYFPGKEDLFKAAVRDVIVPVIAAAEQEAATHAGSAADRLRHFVGRLVAFAGAGPYGAIPKMIIAEAHNFPALARFYAEPVATRGHALGTSVIAAGVRSGEFRPVDPGVAAQCLIAPALLALIWRHSLAPYSSVDFDPAAIAATDLDIFLTGLRADPQPQPDMHP